MSRKPQAPLHLFFSSRLGPILVLVDALIAFAAAARQAGQQHEAGYEKLASPPPEKQRAGCGTAAGPAIYTKEVGLGLLFRRYFLSTVLVSVFSSVFFSTFLVVSLPPQPVAAAQGDHQAKASQASEKFFHGGPSFREKVSISPEPSSPRTIQQGSALHAARSRESRVTEPGSGKRAC